MRIRRRHWRRNPPRRHVGIATFLDDIAKGAAMMTGTTFEKQFIDGLADTVPKVPP